MNNQHHKSEGVSRLPEVRIIESSTPAVRFGTSLPWQIVGFLAALLLITIASHVLGGVAGRWTERQDSGSVATWPHS